MKIKCQNCNREWEYTGKQEYYTNCPKCMAKVNLKKQRKEKENENKKM